MASMIQRASTSSYAVFVIVMVGCVRGQQSSSTSAPSQTATQAPVQSTTSPTSSPTPQLPPCIAVYCNTSTDCGACSPPNSSHYAFCQVTPGQRSHCTECFACAYEGTIGLSIDAVEGPCGLPNVCDGTSMGRGFSTRITVMMK